MAIFYARLVWDPRLTPKAKSAVTSMPSSRPLITLATVITLLAIQPPAMAQYCHHHTGYVSWGVDEYELFGLTESELTQKFKGTLRYDKTDSHAYFNEGGIGGPQFILTFIDKRVGKVQRLFIDGAGCHIKGPVISSRKEALEFSIDGLSKMPSRAKDDEQRLKEAKELLRKLGK